MHILAMHEILPGIFAWGSTYTDRPWDLNGYAIVLDGETVLVDPPAPDEGEWSSLSKPITTIVLTNRDHVRDTETFRKRYGARVTAGKAEISQLAPLIVDVAVEEVGLIPEQKLDDPQTLKRSLLKLLGYEFDVLLLCDGQSVLSDAKRKVREFLGTL